MMSSMKPGKISEVKEVAVAKLPKERQEHEPARHAKASVSSWPIGGSQITHF